MTYANKLAIARGVMAILAGLFAAMFFYILATWSYGHCHGSDHYARGYYCETVYSNEDGYRALR